LHAGESVGIQAAGRGDFGDVALGKPALKP
jgi:hypothetical protein